MQNLQMETKIIQRRDGSKLKIMTRLTETGLGVLTWNTCVMFQPVRRFNSKGEQEWRAVSSDVATPDEVHSAKMEVWEGLRPLLK